MGDGGNLGRASWAWSMPAGRSIGPHPLGRPGPGGAQLTPAERSCLRDAFEQAGSEHDEITDDIIGPYVRPCIGG